MARPSKDLPKEIVIKGVERMMKQTRCGENTYLESHWMRKWCGVYRYERRNVYEIVHRRRATQRLMKVLLLDFIGLQG